MRPPRPVAVDFWADVRADALDEVPLNLPASPARLGISEWVWFFWGFGGKGPFYAPWAGDRASS